MCLPFLFISYLFFYNYPKAIASAVGSVAFIVNVSFPPLLFSTKVIAVPATNLPFKNPAVVSLLDTFTKASVSAEIATHAEPL